MNIFNRIVVVLLLLFFIVLSIIAIVSVFSSSFIVPQIALSVFSPIISFPNYIATIILLFIIAVCIALLLLEFYRKKHKIVKINNVGGGKAMITVDTIAQQIKESVLGIGGIKNLKTEINPKSGGIIVSMLVEIAQNINIPLKMTEIITAVKQVCTEKLNIKVIDTKLTLTNLISDGKVPEKINQQDSKEKETGEVPTSSVNTVGVNSHDTGSSVQPTSKDSLNQTQLNKLDENNQGKKIEITETALIEESED